MIPPDSGLRSENTQPKRNLLIKLPLKKNLLNFLARERSLESSDSSFWLALSLYMAAQWAGVGRGARGERAEGGKDTVMGAQDVGPTSTNKTTPGCILQKKFFFISKTI